MFRISKSSYNFRKFTFAGFYFSIALAARTGHTHTLRIPNTLTERLRTMATIYFIHFVLSSFTQYQLIVASIAIHD